MVKKIIVATDGSGISRKAVQFSADLARQTGASLVLVGVIDTAYLLSPIVPPQLSPSGVMESADDLLRQATEAYLDQSLGECRQLGLEVSRVVRRGHPVEEIVAEAESSHADLIVVGSHGRSALKAAVLGSVAYGVLHKDAKIPVLVVRR